MNTIHTTNSNQLVSAEEIARNHFKNHNIHGDPNAAGEAYGAFVEKILTDAEIGRVAEFFTFRDYELARKIALNSYFYEAHRCSPQGIIKMLMGDPHELGEKMNHNIREKAALNSAIGCNHQAMQNMIGEYSKAIVLTYTETETRSNRVTIPYRQNPARLGTDSFTLKFDWLETTPKVLERYNKQVAANESEQIEEGKIIEKLVERWYKLYLEHMMCYLTGSDKEVSPRSRSVQRFFVSDSGTTFTNPLFPPSWTTGCVATLDSNGEVTDDGFDMTISPTARLARLIQTGTGGTNFAAGKCLFSCLDKITKLMSSQNPHYTYTGIKIPYMDHKFGRMMQQPVRGIILLPFPAYGKVSKDADRIIKQNNSQNIPTFLNKSPSNKRDILQHYQIEDSDYFMYRDWMICRMNVYQEWRTGDIIPVCKNHAGETAWINFSEKAELISDVANQRGESYTIPIGAIPTDGVLYRIPILVGNALMLIHKNIRPFNDNYYYGLCLTRKSMGDYVKYANTFMPLNLVKEKADKWGYLQKYSSGGFYGMAKLREAIRLSDPDGLISMKDMGSFTLDMLY